MPREVAQAATVLCLLAGETEGYSRGEEGRKKGWRGTAELSYGNIESMTRVESQGFPHSSGFIPTLANRQYASFVFLSHVRPGCGLQETLNHTSPPLLPDFLPDHTIDSQRYSTSLWFDLRMPLEKEEVRVRLERTQDVCGSVQASWNGHFLLPARHRQDCGAWRGMGLAQGLQGGSWGSPGSSCAAPTQAGYESAHSWAQRRPHCGGVSSLRGRTAVYFSCCKGEGRGGMEELTLLVLTLAQDPWKGRDLRSRHCIKGGLWASLPHSWGS